MMKRIRIKKKPKVEKTYDEVIKEINPTNIPREWTYDMVSTLPKLLGAYLEKYLVEADKMIVVPDDMRDIILDLIIEFKKLEDDEYIDNSELIFSKLGEILPKLWW